MKSKSKYYLLRLYLITSFFALLSFQASSQWLSDSTADILTTRGVNFIYSIKFDSAETEFQKLIKLNPNHPSGYFFLAMIDWWRIMMDLNDESYDEIFYDKLEEVISLCNKLLKKDKNNLDALFFKGGAIGFRGRLRVHRESWLLAANDGRLAIPIVHQAYDIDSTNVDVLLGMGIYNYYRDVIPEMYPFVKPIVILFPSGDKNLGMQQLRIAAEQARYAKYEASYFLIQTLFHFEKQYSQALPFALKLHNQFPKNPIFHRFAGRIYAALGRWEEMNRTFSEIADLSLKNYLGYNGVVLRESYYYQGLYYMNLGKYDKALEKFYRCDEISRNVDIKEQSGFMTMTNLKIGMIYDLQKKRDLAIKQYNKVLKLKSYDDSREKAKQYLKKPYGQF